MYWILTLPDTILDNRVYCTRLYLALYFIALSIFMDMHRSGKITRQAQSRNRAIHCAVVGGVISIQVHVDVVFSATNQTKDSAVVVEAMSWACKRSLLAPNIPSSICTSISVFSAIGK